MKTPIIIDTLCSDEKDNFNILCNQLKSIREEVAEKKLVLETKEREVVSRMLLHLMSHIPSAEQKIMSTFGKLVEPVPGTGQENKQPVSLLEELVTRSIDLENMEAQKVEFCLTAYRLIGNADTASAKKFVDDMNRCSGYFKEFATFQVRLHAGNQICFCFELNVNEMEAAGA